MNTIHEVQLQDEATGVTHHLVPGDFAFFHVGSKVKVCYVPSPSINETD